MSAERITVYVNAHCFELTAGERVEATVVWPWWVLPLALTLKISVVDARTVRLDSGRRLQRRRGKWRVVKLAQETTP